MHNGTDKYITVVSGLPRSGTSLMMHMLERGGIPVMTDGFRSADHDNPLGYFEYEAVKRMDRDVSWLPDAYGKALKVIHILLYKLPANHHYRVIFMNRNLQEVIASQKIMLEHRQEGMVLSEEQLAASYRRQLQQLHGWLAQQSNMEVLVVDHREALTSPAEIANKVSAFLDLPLDQAAMAATVDPALHRNRVAVASPG